MSRKVQRQLGVVASSGVMMALLLVAPMGAQPSSRPGKMPPYGNNAAVGKTFVHDGVRLYYEVYGKGEPLLLIHGNGGSIGEMKWQIDHFRRQYRVIAMDSRDHGKSADSAEALNYEKMTGDLVALLDHLEVRAADVVGWSDGGIEALLLAMKYPARVKKVVSMAANLKPEGAHPAAVELIRSMLDGIPAAARQTPSGKREYKVGSMMLSEPQIELQELEAIEAPVLVLAGDHDLIADEHTLAIYHHLRNSQLAIFPNATHMIPVDDPATFNATVERFLRTPFVKKDRIKDLMVSFEKLRGDAK